MLRKILKRLLVFTKRPAVVANQKLHREPIVALANDFIAIVEHRLGAF